jgi:hypothetical protein
MIIKPGCVGFTIWVHTPWGDNNPGRSYGSKVVGTVYLYGGAVTCGELYLNNLEELGPAAYTDG